MLSIFVKRSPQRGGWYLSICSLARWYTPGGECCRRHRLYYILKFRIIGYFVRRWTLWMGKLVVCGVAHSHTLFLSFFETLLIIKKASWDLFGILPHLMKWNLAKKIVWKFSKLQSQQIDLISWKLSYYPISDRKKCVM